MSGDQTEPKPDRLLHFERRMSEAEALMWNIEKDPWLNPSGATVTILDRPIDVPMFRRRIAAAVADIPRLRQHVVPGIGRVAPPSWATDTELDLEFHVRHISLPAPGTRRQLYDLVTRFYEDPFDRTRPLWQFVVIDGLEGGRSALFMKLHHTISDGNGLVRISESYMERRREAPAPPDIDLAQILADAVAAEHAEQAAAGEGSGSDPAGFLNSAASSVNHLVRRQFGVARRMAGGALRLSTNPVGAKEAGEDAVATLRSLYGQLVGSGGEVAGGSPLWKHRSRRRHLESLRLPLPDVKRAGIALGGSVNDVFVTGAVMGALRYHDERGVDVDALNISFVVSTKTDDSSGTNSFTPSRVQIPGAAMTAQERFDAVRALMEAGKSEVRGSGALSGIAGVANLLPTSVVTRFARGQAAKMDFATSNLRAAPFTMYISGAEILESATMGPVAGTAFNLTALSYNGWLDLGLFIDPVAVDDPAALRYAMVAAYDDLLRAGGVGIAVKAKPKASPQPSPKSVSRSQG